MALVILFWQKTPTCHPLRHCVIKQLKPDASDPKILQVIRERFRQEAVILEALGNSSDQIPSLYAYFNEGEEFYLAQEWIEGETLTQIIQRQGPLKEQTVTAILSSLLPVLTQVHQHRIVHRDIKPDNIILRHRDGQPVLIDFGAGEGNNGHSVDSLGTPPPPS